MDEQNIIALLQKYKAGTITPEEKRLLESWYIHYAGHSPHQLDSQSLDDVFHQLQSELLPAAHTKQRRLWPRIAAAAAIVLLLLTGGYYFLHRARPEATKLAVQTPQDIAPGSNKAVLTLANGSRIVVTGASAGTLAQQANMVVTKTADGSLTYQAATASGAGADMRNTLATQMGGETSLTLSDGTLVKLDAASSITYPVAFTGSERRVTVTGQAYFKVKHNSRQPFVVVANGQTIRDIGTEFNVNTYHATSTTLVEGSIAVNGKVLVPGQQAVSGRGGLQVERTDLEETVAWTKGYFRFHNEDIHSIMDKISRWYNIEVVYEPGVSTGGITGTVSRYKNISQVFYMLSYGQHIHFKIEGRRVTVMK